MTIFIGADHRGYNLKQKIITYLIKKGHRVSDEGTHSSEKSCDYPKMAFKVACGVATTKNSRGILICMTGIGNAIAANKVPGVRAALCYNRSAARLCRQHNDANVLVLGAKFVGSKNMTSLVNTFLKTAFEGGRHLRRVRQIRSIEQKYCKK